MHLLTLKEIAISLPRRYSLMKVIVQV